MWALLAAGVLARVVIGAVTYGSEIDVGNMHLTARLLVGSPLDVYGQLMGPGGVPLAWPYPPGYFPWLAATQELSQASGFPFHSFFGLPPMAADIGIAWFVQDHLRRAGAAERTRLAAFALVVLGSSFVMISGFHHQFDAVAFLPAVAAFWLWERRPPGRRALACGVLIGVGALLKTMPIVLLLALLPACRDLREAVTLAGAAVAVLAAGMAPWLIWDPAITEAMRYAGIPSAGGLTLVLHPAGAATFIAERVPWNDPVSWIVEHRFTLNLALLAALALLLVRARPRPVCGAVLIVLALYSFTSGFFLQYLVWGLPFLLMAGHLRSVAAIQAVTLPAAALFYLAPWESETAVVVYATLMIALWLALLGGFAVLARRALQSSQAARNAGASAWR